MIELFYFFLNPTSPTPLCTFRRLSITFLLGGNGPRKGESPHQGHKKNITGIWTLSSAMQNHLIGCRSCLVEIFPRSSSTNVNCKIDWQAGWFQHLMVFRSCLDKNFPPSSLTNLSWKMYFWQVRWCQQGWSLSTWLPNKRQLKNRPLASQVMPTGLRIFHPTPHQMSIERSTLGKSGGAKHLIRCRWCLDKHYPSSSSTNFNWNIYFWQARWCQKKIISANSAGISQNVILVWANFRAACLFITDVTGIKRH